MTEIEKNKKKGRPSKTEKAIREGNQKTIDSFFKNEKVIPIKELIIEIRKRSQYSEAKVNELAESIKEVGLMNPVLITEDKKLVAGFHRILAFKKLGRKEIPYRMTTITDPLKLELQEIDENLVRGELIALEECEQLLRRKQIYEELHPDTKKGMKGGWHNVKTKKLENEKISLSRSKTFSKELANKMNVSQRTIQTKIKIARDIIQALRDCVRNTKIARRKGDLGKISKFSEEYQAELIDTINNMKKEDIIIDNLVTVESQHKLYENEKQNQENHKVIKTHEKNINSATEFFEDKIAYCDVKAYEYIREGDGTISFDKYRKLWNTDLWREGKQLKYVLNQLLGKNQPPFEDCSFHHESPYPWEHLFSRGIFILKSEHKKGGNL